MSSPMETPGVKSNRPKATTTPPKTGFSLSANTNNIQQSGTPLRLNFGNTVGNTPRKQAGGSRRRHRRRHTRRIRR